MSKPVDDERHEQPMCPECEGRGHHRDNEWDDDTYHSCPRCGGSGVERMVPLAEVVAWLRTHYGDWGRGFAAELEHRFGGGQQ